MSTEAVRNSQILSPHEAEARTKAYQRVHDEGLLRFSRDSMHVVTRMAGVAEVGPLIVKTLEFSSPIKVTLEASEDGCFGVDYNFAEKLKTIDVMLGTLFENIHYVFKNGNLLKRSQGGGDGIQKFQTGFENVGAQEAENLADFIKDPNIENLRKYRKDIHSTEPMRPFSLARRLIRS